MSILKFLNPGKRKLSLLSREEVEKLDKKVPGTNTNSNRTVIEAKKKAKEDVDVKHQTRKANRRISKQLADEATKRMVARREREEKGIHELPVSLQLSDAYAASHGEIMGKIKERLMDIITFPFMCIAILPMVLLFHLLGNTKDEDWERAKGDDVIDDYEYKKQKLIEYWKSTGMIFDEYGNMTYEDLNFGNINQVNIIENYDMLILKHQ